MSMGKSAPEAPDYSAIAESSDKAAQLSYDLAKETLDWSKDTYNEYFPYVRDYMDAQTLSTTENRQRAGELYDYYKDTYQPIETEFAQSALDYVTPQRIEQNAAAAIADVGSEYAAKRSSALANLESYGIDPSQTRYGALDLGSRLAEAAAGAAAGTQSRLNTEAVGLGLMGEAINTGRGYQSNVSGAYDTATKAGYYGTKAGNELYGTGSTAMTRPATYINSGTSALGTWSSALNNQYNNEASSAQIGNANTTSTFKGIGSLLGGGLGFGMYKGWI